MTSDNIKFNVYNDFVPKNVKCELFINGSDSDFRYFYGVNKNYNTLFVNSIQKLLKCITNNSVITNNSINNNYDSFFEYNIQALLKSITNNGEKILRIVGKGCVLNNISKDLLNKIIDEKFNEKIFEKLAENLQSKINSEYIVIFDGDNFAIDSPFTHFIKYLAEKKNKKVFAIKFYEEKDHIIGRGYKKGFIEPWNNTQNLNLILTNTTASKVGELISNYLLNIGSFNEYFLYSKQKIKEVLNITEQNEIKLADKQLRTRIDLITPELYTILFPYLKNKINVDSSSGNWTGEARDQRQHKNSGSYFPELHDKKDFESEEFKNKLSEVISVIPCGIQDTIRDLNTKNITNIYYGNYLQDSLEKPKDGWNIEILQNKDFILFKT